MTTSWLLFLLLHSCLVIARRNGLSVLLILVDGPVKDVVILESFADEKVTEDLAEVGVVRLVIKAEGTGVVQVDGKLIGESTAEDLGGCSHLLFHDTVVLLLLGGSLESLPGEGATAEVEHDISKGFHVVTTGLLNTKMSVDAGITCSSRQVLILTVWNMEVSLRVPIFLGQSEINHVDLVSTLSNAHEEIVRLNITVDEGLGMNVLNTRDELIREQ